jgi:hypothetical protein
LHHLEFDEPEPLDQSFQSEPERGDRARQSEKRQIIQRQGDDQ